MNKKDYNAIAKIIKSRTFLAIVHGMNKLDMEVKDGLQVPICESNVISNALADYFERNTKVMCVLDKKKHGTKFIKEFNRQKFLTDCGIEV